VTLLLVDAQSHSQPPSGDIPAEATPSDTAQPATATSLPSPRGEKPDKPLRLLVVGAHPADVFDQSGGTMAHHTARGDWVGCVVLTHGVRVHDKVIADEMAKLDEIPDAATLQAVMQERADVKTQEVIKACGLLGVKERDVYFFGADDGVLLVKDETIRQIARLIRKLKPDIILTHYPMEGAAIASSHATTGHMVMYAQNLAGSVDPGDTNPPHSVAQTFFFGIGAAAARTDVWGGQGGFVNDVYVDITDVVETKVACLDMLESQGYGGAYARKRIETSDGHFGSRVDVAYAEPFITCYSTSHYFLPLSEHDLQKSRATDQDRMQRRSFKANFP
jgi:LmbE family N-acetylglucosaminyl deacetylase